MPPITRPVSRKSNSIITRRLGLPVGLSGATCACQSRGPAKNGPAPLQREPRLPQANRQRLERRRNGSRQASRRDALVLAALPLADPPQLGEAVAVQLDVAEHGLEGAGLEHLDVLGALDLAHDLDG